ncbi:DUF3822 family protein [Flavimarina sp. Hel_I_48]|uniref:DUF3822 family protein n=1 Tax=Flavimarina sp. Hel_I_48 TaxID=1392488 RepID=UPI0006916332|nr:DUF3822 family protein [Flavimarina sp. Hel_I_48]
MKIISKEKNIDENIVSIQVSLDGFSFYAYNKDTGNRIVLIDLTTEDTGTPDYILQQLQKVFDANEDYLSRFNNVQVVYSNELFTVVPQALFDPEHITDYLKYNTKILSTDFIVYDELKELDLIVVYIPFANINNFFFDHFGSFSYHHSITLFIKNIHDKAVAVDKEITIQLRDRNFDLIAQEGKKLVLINAFTYQNAEDFLYHILFCYEQLNFDPDKDKLTIIGTLDVENDLYQLARKYIRTITLQEENPSIRQENTLH